jgi:hypothetical protein
MTCEDAQAHLPDHLARTLPVSVAAEVDAHVRTCDTCAADYAASEDTWHRLRAIPTVEPNTASMRTRFEAGLQAHIVERQPRQAMHRSFAYYGLQVAAAAVLVLLGVIIGRQAPPSPTSDSQLVALRNELRDMREMVAVSLLQQPSATERLKGVSWSNQIDQPGPLDGTADIYQDPPPRQTTLRPLTSRTRNSTTAITSRTQIKLPSVYPLTIPSSQRMIKMIAMVSSMPSSPLPGQWLRLRTWSAT